MNGRIVWILFERLLLLIISVYMLLWMSLEKFNSMTHEKLIMSFRIKPIGFFPLSSSLFSHNTHTLTKHTPSRVC